ncbi:hypothetical protein LXA43DRAFT_1023267, partial [Ganoderma leucocontextum]
RPAMGQTMRTCYCSAHVCLCYLWLVNWAEKEDVEVGTSSTSHAHHAVGLYIKSGTYPLRSTVAPLPPTHEALPISPPTPPTLEHIPEDRQGDRRYSTSGKTPRGV